MTEREYNLKNAEAAVRDSGSRLEEAKRNRDAGIRRAQAQFDSDVAKLNGEFERSKIQFDRDVEYLVVGYFEPTTEYFNFRKSEAERGFDT